MNKINTPFSFKNGATLRNPIVMAPMTTWSGDDQGRLSHDELAYYRARANGVGMLITGTTFTVPNGQGFTGQFYAGDDRFIPQLHELASLIKSGGAKAILQIFHAGRMRSPELPAADVVSASDIPSPRSHALNPRALEPEEIGTIIRSFADTTRRAIRAGFDGVEIHGANTYLIQQFFSPHSNRRNDEWGGTREKRARFPLAVVDAVTEVAKAQAAGNFIVGYRISPEEVEEPGITLDDTCYLVDRLADKPLTYLHLSLADYRQTSQRDQKDSRIVGQVVHQCLKGRLPLIAVGSVLSADDVQQAFGLGYELLAVGQALIMDPRWLEKIRSGESPETTLSTQSIQERHVPEKMLQSLRKFPRSHIRFLD